MARAAGHLARGVVRAARAAGYGRRVVLVVGKGNNGGDGWAAAHRLHALGCGVTVASRGAHRRRHVRRGHRPPRPAGWRGAGAPSCGLDAVQAAVDDPSVDVLVDCLLGTGIAGRPAGRGRRGLRRDQLRPRRRRDAGRGLRRAVRGVLATTAPPPGDAVRADATVTLGGMKRGLVLHPGAAHAGRVLVGDLGPRYAPPAADDAAGPGPPSTPPRAPRPCSTRPRTSAPAGPCCWSAARSARRVPRSCDPRGAAGPGRGWPRWPRPPTSSA